MKLLILFFAGISTMPVLRGQTPDTIPVTLYVNSAFVIEGQSCTIYAKEERFENKLFNVFAQNNRQLKCDHAFRVEGYPFVSVGNMKKGRYTFPQNIFEYHGQMYKTQPLVMEVIDSFPDIEQGLWIRALATSDSTVDILINQHNPFKDNQLNAKDPGSAGMKERSNKWVSFKKLYPDDPSGFFPESSSTSTYLVSGLANTGKKKYWVSRTTLQLRKPNGKEWPVLDESYFLNLPPNHTFTSVIIR